MNFRHLIYRSVLWRGFYFASVLALNIMIARYYEAEYSGLIYFIINSFAFIVIIGSFSLEAGIAYYVVSGKAESPPLANFAIGWTIVATIFALIALFFLGRYHFISSNYSQYYFAALCYIGGCMLVNFFTGLFYAKKDFLTPNLLMTIVNLALIALVPFSNGRFYSKEIYIDIYFAGFLLQGLVMAFLFFVVNQGKWVYSLPGKETLKPVFKYALHAFWANSIFFLLYRIDYWFVERYCTEKDLGNYIQVSKLVQLFLILPAMIASAIFPMSASGDKEALHRGLALLSRMIVFSYCMICLLLTATGYWLFPLVYGASFDNMFFPFILLIPGIVAVSVISLLSSYFAGQNRVRVNAIGALYGFLFIVVADLIVVPMFGIKGAAITSSIGYTINLLFAFKKIMQAYNGSFLDFILIRKSDFKLLLNWQLQKKAA